jgi:hypothetical protein
MKRRMGRQDVFLAVDNVEDAESSRQQVRDFLKCTFSAGSKVLVTGRSSIVVRNVLGRDEETFCKPVPNVDAIEALSIFLDKAAPGRSISLLSAEEKYVVWECAKQACFSGKYHPLALRALASYYNEVDARNPLRWLSHLNDIHRLRLCRESKSRTTFQILGLGFGKLPIFLDKAAPGRSISLLSAEKKWLRTPQPPIAYTALLGASAILLLWLTISIDDFNPSIMITLFFTLLVVTLGQAYAKPMGERSSLDCLLSVVNVTMEGYNILPFVLIVAVVFFLAPSSFTSSLITSTILGVGLLMLVLEMRRSVHLRLLWYKATGESLRPCNMLKAQYYSQNLRGALFISKDAPDGCWSYHPDFSLTGQRRENDEDLEDEFEVSGYTYKCRYQYPTSFVDVTMRGKLIKSIETPLELEVHDMFIRLIHRWKRKVEDGVFYGMQIVWGVNVTHCLEVEELYKLLVEGHVPVQYVNGPYMKALVMGEREILASFINVIITIISCFGIMYVNYGGHVVINGMALSFFLIAGGTFIRTLHLCTYMDVESKIFSYKYLRWFKYWEYRGQVLRPDRYCMEVMGHPVHVEGGKHYAELTRSDFLRISVIPFPT